MAVTKVINSESKQYKPVLTDMLVLDAVPTVNSLNGVTSDAVARAIAGASGEVPQVTENDNGKVLGAIYDEGGAAVEWVEPPVALPDMTGNDGKILGAVDNSGTMEAQWISKPVSNVTTTMGSFTVGVNGSGAPVTVDCFNGTRQTQNTGSNYSAGGSTISGTWYAALKFDLGENVTVDGNAWGNPLFVVPTTVSVTLPTGSSLIDSNSGLLFAQIYESGGQTFISNRGTPYSWASTNPITVTTVGDVSTVTLTAGSYEFVKAWNPNPSYDTLLFFLAFTGTLTSEAQTELENALSGCTVKNNTQFGSGFTKITGYSIKPAVIPDINSYQANKFLKVGSNGSYLQWSTLSVDEVPTVGSTDDGKVLTASYSGGVGSYSWETAQGGGSSLPSITGNEYKVLSVNSNASATEWTLPLRKAGFTVNFDSTKKIYTVSVPNSGYQLYGVEGEFLSTISIMSYSSTTINNLWLLINDSQYNDADTQSSVDSFYWTKAIQVISGTATMNEYKPWPLFMTELSLRKKSSGQVKVHLALSSSPSIADAINNVSISGVTGRLLETI